MTADAWTVRITFAWTGPPESLRHLGEAGVLEHRSGQDYAWTATLAGDVGPGTTEQREGRAMSLAEDALCIPLQEAHGAAAVKCFTHHATELVRDGADG